ncbi:hypothetical protein [Thiolapillus sp.]
MTTRTYPLFSLAALLTLSMASYAGPGINVSTDSPTPLIGDLGFAIKGENLNNTTGSGVIGISNGTTAGNGVFGQSTNTGVYGVGNNFGIFGKSINGWAVYSEGDTKVTGDLFIEGATSADAQDTPVCMGADGKLASCKKLSLGFSSRIAWVGDGPGAYSSISAALSDLTNNKWCQNPTTDNPCILKLSPGVHDLGSQTLSVPGSLIIEGQGPNVTTIQGSADPLVSFQEQSETFELRNVSLKTTTPEVDQKFLEIGNKPHRVVIDNVKIDSRELKGTFLGIDIKDASDVVLRNIHITLIGKVNENPIFFGIIADAGSFVDIQNLYTYFSFPSPGSGTSILANNSSFVRIRNGQLGSQDEFNVLVGQDSRVDILHSTLSSSTTPIRTTDASATVYVSFSDISGNTNSTSGSTILCQASMSANTFVPNGSCL